MACISASGGVKEIDGKRLIVDFRTKTLAKRAINILLGNNIYTNDSYISNDKNNNRQDNDFLENEIIIIPDEINLTKRLLEPLHKFHKLAANILVPSEVFEFLSIEREVKEGEDEKGEKGGITI